MCLRAERNRRVATDEACQQQRLSRGSGELWGGTASRLLATMSAALQTLRRNDPQQTEIFIDLNEEEDDAAIAQALEQNQYVSRVWLNLAQRISSWDHLYRVLATRGNLEHFGLANYNMPEPSPSRRGFVPILQAIQQNASVRVVEFCYNNLGHEDLCSFLDTADHVTDLTLKNLQFDWGSTWCERSRGSPAAKHQHCLAETVGDR